MCLCSYFLSFLSDSFCTPPSSLILLKHVFIHMILWLKSIACLLALQDLIQALSPHISGLLFHHLPLSTSPRTLFPVTKILSNPLKFISSTFWSTYFFFLVQWSSWFQNIFPSLIIFFL